MLAFYAELYGFPIKTYRYPALKEKTVMVTLANNMLFTLAIICQFLDNVTRKSTFLNI